MPTIEACVNKSCEGFSRKLIINWEDGAKTEIEKEEIILHGNDGITRRIPPKEVHAIDCKEILRINGYNFAG